MLVWGSVYVYTGVWVIRLRAWGSGFWGTMWKRNGHVMEATVLYRSSYYTVCCLGLKVWVWRLRFGDLGLKVLGWSLEFGTKSLSAVRV